MKLIVTVLIGAWLASASSFVELTSAGRDAFARGDYRAAEEQWRLAKQVAAGEPDESAAIAAANLATLDYTMGRAAKAVIGYREALRYWESSGEQGQRLRATLRQLADALHQLGEYAEARQHLRRLEGLIERDATVDANALARLRMSMARIETAMGQTTKAANLYRQVLSGPPVDSAIRAAALDGLGDSCLARGKSAEAEKAFEEALALWTSLNHAVRAASTANRLGDRWLSDRRPRRALPYLKRALEVFEEKGIGGVQLVSTLNNLGQAHRFAGDAKEAFRYYERAIGTATRDLGADHSFVAAIELNAADFAMSRKKYGEAEQHLRQALRIDELRFGRGHPDVARDIARMAKLHLLQKQRALANGELGEALAILGRSQAALTSEHAEWFELRAGLLRGAENYAEAARLEAEAMRIRVKLLLR